VVGIDLGKIIVRFGADTSQLAQAAKQVEKSLDSVADAAAKTTDSIEDMDKASRQSATTAAQAASKTSDSMRNVAAVSDAAAKKVTANWKTVANGMKSAGTTMTKAFTVPIMAVAGVAVASSLAWDDAMDEIAIRTGATGKELEGLQGAFRNVGRSMPNGLMEVSTVVSSLNTRMGLSGDMVEDLATQFLNAGRMAKIAPDQLVESFGQMARGWTLGVAEYATANDKMWLTAQKTGINMLNLQQSMTDLGPTLRSLGYDFDQSTAMIGRFYELGVDPGNLTTALRTATAQFREMGISPQKGLAAYAKGIREAKDEQTRLALATQAFGERAAPLMADAIKRGAFQLDEFVAGLSAAPGAIGRTNEATWGWSEQLGQMKNQFSELFAPIGDKALGIVSEKLPTVAAAVDKLVTSFGKLDPKKQDAFIIGMATLAVAGPALITAAAAMSAIASLSNPVVLAAVAITGMAAGVAMLWAEMSNFEKKLKEQPATPFAELDKITQGQFRGMSETLHSKDQNRSKDVARGLGITTDQLVKAKVVDKDSNLLMTNETELLNTLVALWQGKHESQRPPEAAAASPRATLDKQIAAMKADMEKSVAEMFGSGTAIPTTIAEGIKAAEKLVTDAMLEMYEEADKANPRSDAKIGPFSRLTQSGRSIPLTIARGVGQTVDKLVATGSHMAAAVMDPMDSMTRRLFHNARGMRDTLGDLWWQTGDRISAATRYGVDSALDNMDDLGSPQMVLSLDESMLKFAPDELKNALQDALNAEGPQGLILDADLQPRIYDDKRIGAFIANELAKIGPVSITVPADVNIEAVQLTLDNIVPEPAISAIERMKGSLQLLSSEAATTAVSLGLSLDEATTNFDLAAGDMEGTGERVQSLWSQLAAYTIAKWAAASGGVMGVVDDLAANLPPEIRDNVVGQIKSAMATLDSDSEAHMKSIVKSIINNLQATHPAIAGAIKQLEQFGNKIDSLKGPVGEFARGAKKAFEELGKAVQKSFGEMAANALVTYFDQLATGEKELKDFRSVMREFLLDFISMVEKQVLASQAAGIAVAVAKAPATFGASLLEIPPILAQAAAALAVFEGLKAGLRVMLPDPPQPPAMAAGGIVTGPTLAMVGEGGEPEVVLPLSRLSGMLPNQQGSSVVLNLTISGNTIMNERDIDKLTDRVMNRATKHLRSLGYKPSYA